MKHALRTLTANCPPYLLFLLAFIGSLAFGLVQLAAALRNAAL